MAAGAITIPNPESRSTPGARISSAVEVKASKICAPVAEGLADFNNAAIAAAWGAAADVPKNGLNPGVFVETPSAAVMSGLIRRRPPPVPNSRLPGVIGVPSGK